MKRIKIKSVIAGVLLLAMILSACGNNTNTQEPQKNDSVASPVNPIAIQEDHSLINALHQVNVQDSERTFVVNGESEYRIIAGEGTDTQTAASFFATYIAKATGCTLPVVDASAYEPNGKYIVFNVPELFQKAGLTMPEADFGVMGYYIKSVGDNLFVSSKTDEGARFAMLCLLRHIVGFEMYSLDTVVFSKSGATLPDMEIIEKPDVTYLMNNNGVTGGYEAQYMMGFSLREFIYIDGWPWHNVLYYLPLATYQSEHPDWYSSHGNDLCYTAHGNEEELQLMAQTIADRIIKECNANPYASYVTVTMMDHGVVCECENCKASAQKYNGANSAAVIKFTNRIGEIVQAELQRQADEAGTEKRILTVMFFAYHALTQPPVIKNADGSYSPIDEDVVCGDRVAVYYAPIMSDFAHSYYNESNQSYADITKGWAACSDKIYAWLYETNFAHYMYPYNSWDSMLETYRFLVNNNTEFIMPQGQWNNPGSSAFSDFKDYINSCAAIDLSCNYNEILDNYFKNYYGPAEKPMRQYFDELNMWMRTLEQNYPAEVSGNIYTSINQAKFWPSNMLLHWMDLIDEAYAAIEPLREEQPMLYEKLERHIKLESIFPRYAFLEFHSGKLSVNVVAEMKLAFKEDCEQLSTTRLDEATAITSLWDRWGLN